MRRLLSVFLLVLQLGPLAGAGLCLRAAQHESAECTTPMEGMTHEGAAPEPASTPECAHLVICAPPAPMVPVSVQIAIDSRPSPTQYSSPASLPAGDPVTPPQPPPIA